MSYAMANKAAKGPVSYAFFCYKMLVTCLWCSRGYIPLVT